MRKTLSAIIREGSSPFSYRRSFRFTVSLIRSTSFVHSYGEAGISIPVSHTQTRIGQIL